MPKYVCDYDQVRNAANKLVQSSRKLESDSTNYHKNMSSSLNSWNGSAKSSFMSQCDNKTEGDLEKARSAEELGEEILTAVSKIEQTDSELATLSI